jgi:hypothetical protein
MWDGQREADRLAILIAKTQPTTLAGCAAVLNWASIHEREDHPWPDTPDYVAALGGIENPRALLNYNVAKALERIRA